MTLCRSFDVPSIMPIAMRMHGFINRGSDPEAAWGTEFASTGAPSRPCRFRYSQGMLIYGAKQLAASFRTVRKNTIQVAEDIPESQYDFVAAPGVRPISRMLSHIAFSTRFWLDFHSKGLTDAAAYDFMGLFAELQAEEEKSRTKAELIDLLRTHGEQFAAFLETLTDEALSHEIQRPGGQPPQSRLENLLSAKEHEMHHRAQLMLAERLVGVEPHLTRQMNEMMAQMQKAAAEGGAASA